MTGTNPRPLPWQLCREFREFQTDGFVDRRTWHFKKRSHSKFQRWVRFRESDRSVWPRNSWPRNSSDHETRLRSSM